MQENRHGIQNKPCQILPFNYAAIHSVQRAIIQPGGELIILPDGIFILSESDL